MNDKKLMTSAAIQQYYSKDYDGFQRSAILSKSETLEDSKRIGNLLIQLISNATDILDLGSGSCQWLPYIKEKVRTYYAVDANLSLLEVAKKNYPNKVVAIQGDAFKFGCYEGPLTASSIVLLSFFLSHFNDESISELLEVLKKQNKQVIVIDSYQNADNPKFEGLKMIHRKADGKLIKLPKRYFYFTELTTLFGLKGFKLDQSIQGNYWLLAVFNPVD